MTFQESIDIFLASPKPLPTERKEVEKETFHINFVFHFMEIMQFFCSSFAASGESAKAKEENREKSLRSNKARKL